MLDAMHVVTACVVLKIAIASNLDFMCMLAHGLEKIGYCPKWREAISHCFRLIFSLSCIIQCKFVSTDKMICWYIQVLCLLVLVADMVIYALYLSPAVTFYSLPVRFAPYVRVVLFILHFRYFCITSIFLPNWC